KLRSLEEIIRFNKTNEDKAMPYFKQETLENAQKKGDLSAKQYKDAYANSHLAAKKIIDALILEHKLDAICGLTMGPACSIDNIYGDRWGDVFLTMPAAVSG